MAQRLSQLYEEISPYIDDRIAAAFARYGSGGGGGGTVVGTNDHGALTGLGDDDHHQYLTSGRGDARYPTLTVYNAHVVNANAHHNQVHALDGSDHTGVLSWAKVSKVGASLADLPTRVYSDLQSRQHSVVGSDHSIAGAQYSVVGATATNTLGLLTPVADASGGVSALLRSNAGALTLDVLTAATRVRSPLLDTASGSLTLGPDGTAVLPTGSILKDLGDYNRKWRTLFAAELYVETLVAQNVLATIGGRIMVAPTTKLIADASAGATTIDVENNNLHSSGPVGAYIYLATAPGGVAQVEVMKVANANPTAITGGYRYTVTRNVDGSGANAWVAGDAVVNIGASAGQGWIDLTSTSTVRNHLGPTMAIYVRTGTAAWTDVKPVYAAGNLRSFVDYGADEYGFGLGNDLTLTPSTGFSGMTGDRTNGLRLFNTEITLYTSGTKFFGIDQTNGVTIVPGTGIAFNRAYGFATTGGTELGGLYAYHNSGSNTLSLQVLANRMTGINSASLQAGTNIGAGAGTVYLAAYGEGRAVSITMRTTGLNYGTTGVMSFAGDYFEMASGVLALGPGSVGAPALILGLNTATGIYQPAANQVGIAISGTQRLLLNSTGATVTGALTVGASLVLDWNGPYYGYAVKADVGSAWARGLNFLNGSNALLGAFGAYGGSDALTYLYAGAAYNDYTVRVDPVNHRVGIGDNVSPTNALSVSGAADFAGNVTVSHASSPAVIVTDTTNSVSGRIAANDTVFQVGSISNHDLTFFSNNSTKATLSTGGDFTLSAAGATLGAPNVNATTAFQRDGVAGGIFVPMTPTNLTDTGSTVWSGVSRAAGTYTFDVNTAANGSVPTEAVAVAIMGTFTWTNSNNSTYATIQKPSGAYSIVARATASAIGIDVAGVVQIDSSGQFTVTITNATSNTSLLRIVGYYI